MNDFESPVLFLVIRDTVQYVMDNSKSKANCEEIMNQKMFDLYKQLVNSGAQNRLAAIRKLFLNGLLDHSDGFDLENAIGNELLLFDDKNLINNVKKRIKHINKLLSSYYDMQKRDDIYFPTKQFLVSYLSCYYKICEFLFQNSTLLYEEFSYNGRFQTVCEYLTYAPATKDCSILSPYCAEALLTFYKTLSDIKNNCDFQMTNSIIKRVIAYTYANKIFRNFRNYVVRDTKTALLSCENTDNFVEKKSYNLSSYELVKPVRFFSKIKRYISTISEKDDCNLIIVGAVYVNPYVGNSDLNDGDEKKLRKYSGELYDLCNWLIMNSETNKHNYNIDIYINRGSMPSFFYESTNDEKKNIHKFIVSGNENKIIIKFHYVDYKELVVDMVKDDNPNYLFKNNCLTLVLDCPFLYEKLHVVSDEINVNDYFRYLPNNYSIDDLTLVHCGPIQKIQKQLNMLLLNRFNKTGHFERRLKERLIKKISRAAVSGKKSEIYIYISSHHSIEASEFSRNYEVRVERYNSKEFGLIHFDDSEDQIIPLETNNKKANRISFTLWNLLVNADVQAVKRIKDEFDLKEDFVMEEYVNNVSISLEWKNDADMFQIIDIKYRNNNTLKSKFNEKIEDIIISYFNTIFNNECNLPIVILNAMREAFYNVFYSKIANVQHAVAYQKLKDYLNSAQEIYLNFGVADECFNDDMDKKYQISAKKKVYVDVIRNLSFDYPSDAHRDIIVSRMRACKISPLQIYDDIIAVCGELNIKDDNLYINTLKARENLA